MVQYVHLARGLEGQVSELVPINSKISSTLISKIKKHPLKDQYLSLYNYEDRHFEQFKQTHSIAGIDDVKTNRLLWDFDDGQLIENAQKDSKELCARLIEFGVPEEKIRCFFSGNKGFHIETVLDESLTRQEFVNITFNLASGLTSFDVRINNTARIIRAPLTRHPESNLYKIPLTIEQLNTWSIEDIKIHAVEISNFIPNEYYDESKWQIALPESLDVLKTQTFKKVGTIEVVDIKGFDINDIDFSKCPKWISKERYALQEGFFYGSESVGQGERNIAFMILAATYRNQGFSPDHALSLLEATAFLQAARTGETEYTPDQLQREVINVVYSPSWKGGIYSKDEPILQLTRKRFHLAETESKLDLVEIKDVGIEFMSFAKNIDKNTIKTGLKRLDDKVLITSGMMVALLAAPGAGKTSFANMFVEHLSKSGENTLYFSLDMYKNLLFTRLLQKYSGYSMQKILNQYKEENADETLINAFASVVSNYSNTFFNFRSGPTVEEIDQEIINYKESSGNKPKLVVIDYLEKVKGPFSDSTANSGYVASRLSDIAKKHDLVVLLLVQPQKAAGDPREELVSYRKIKGASVIEQDSRIIMTLSRPGYNPANMEQDEFACISVVKNNMGNLCQLDFRWDGIAGELAELQDGDIKRLRELREQNAKDKMVVARGYDDGITSSGYKK